MIKFRIYFSILFALFFIIGCGEKLSYSEKINKYNDLVERANLHIDNKNYSTALTLSEEAIKITDTLPDALISQGITLYSFGEHKKAIKSYTKAIKIEGSRSIGYKYRGIAFMRNKKHKKAAKDLIHYLKYHNYNDMEAHQLIQDLFKSNELTKTEIQYYDLLIANNKNEINYYIKRSSLSYKIRDGYKAKQDFNTILKMDPTNSFVLKYQDKVNNLISYNMKKKESIRYLIGAYVIYFIISYLIFRPIVYKKAKKHIGGQYKIKTDPFIYYLPIILFFTYKILVLYYF